MSLFVAVIRTHRINFPSYADDAQLYVAVPPEDRRPVDILFNRFLKYQIMDCRPVAQPGGEKADEFPMCFKVDYKVLLLVPLF